MEKLIKKWWFWTIIGLAVLLVILTIMYVASIANWNLEEKEYESSISSLKDENNKVQIIVKELSEKVTDLQKEEEKNRIEKEIEDLEVNKKKIEQDIKTKEKEKTSIEQELKKLESEVITVKGKAKTYPAGYLVAGEDFEIGRYKIYGGSSNFVVYSEYGDLRVNIILGGSYGVKEYIYTFRDGDEIKANSSFKLQPVE